VIDQSYATGGWGPDEAFVVPGEGKLAASLQTSHSSFETGCGAYGHFKITRYLLRITKDSRYGDSMERMLYNTIAGATPILSDGTTFYYSDYNDQGARKVHYKDKWPCCSGTFPQLTADYHISTYLRSTDGVYVNLFTPSRAQWSDGSGRYGLKQETQYPFDNLIRIQVSGSQDKEYTLYVRVPSWAGSDLVLSVNGKRVTESVQAGSFAALRRTWKDGDRIELELPMPLRLEVVDANHPNLVALVRGPLVLFAVADSQPTLERNALLQAKQANNAKGDWVANSVDGGSVTMRPFVNIDKESYSAYVLMKT
jgi:uncharacterized protein